MTNNTNNRIVAQSKNVHHTDMSLKIGNRVTLAGLTRGGQERACVYNTIVIGRHGRTEVATISVKISPVRRKPLRPGVYAGAERVTEEGGETHLATSSSSNNQCIPARSRLGPRAESRTLGKIAGG